MVNPEIKRGYESPWAEVEMLLPSEDVLAGASNYTETDIDWDEYWGEGNN